jgi:GNAT superfamily N-acetyltransferase
MCDEWMPTLVLPLTLEQFHQLPRNAAYKYEFLGGQVYLSPRPKHYHALLDLQPGAVDPGVEGVTLRHLEAADWEKLVPLFSSAFARIQPFGSLDDETRRQAASQSLERTRSGGDGPWIAQASFVAVSRVEAYPIGAILITLLPAEDPSDFDAYYWKQPPPADCIARCLGRPHLTWIFVGALHAGEGVGTSLLAAAVHELCALGYGQLASTFMIGNDSSMLWHWRNGFRLLPYPGSRRELNRRWLGHQRG